MNNKEMIEYKENLISKVKRFFKNLFSNKKQVYLDKKNISNDGEQEIKTKQNESDFSKNIKINNSDIDDVYKRTVFLKEIDGNAKALNMLSVERLKALEKYYDNLIKQNEEIIKRMQN